MIEINFTAKGETLTELLVHMNMVKMLIELRKNDEVVEDCSNKGKNDTSSYEYSIKCYSKITGVAIQQLGKGITSMVKGSHVELMLIIIHNGHFIKSKDRIEGFELEDGTFLNREDAYLHAIKSGQIQKGERFSLNSGKPKLYSQDLW